MTRLNVHVRHCAEGWPMGGSSTPEECTSNFFRQQDGRPPCTSTAVWRVVEDHGLHLTIGLYCDADLPAEHLHHALAVNPARGNRRQQEERKEGT